jgi:hypothetical protein
MSVSFLFERNICLTINEFRYKIENVADAGWSSPVARRAHNPKVVGSNPAPATNFPTTSNKLLAGKLSECYNGATEQHQLHFMAA